MKFTLLILLALSGSAVAQPEPPPKAALDRYAKELDHLEQSCMRTDCFSDQRYWRESLKVARRTDPGIVHAVMLRSRKWRDEEGLVYVPLLALLPRPAVTKILREWEHSKRELDRVWAHEFFVEFDSDDVKEAVRALSGSHP